MKKILLLLITSATCFLISCNGSKSNETASTMAGMKEAQLKINGNSLSIMVPDDPKSQISIVEQSWGATEIKVGKDFQISISEGKGDIALTKSDIAANDVNKFKRYLTDEPTLLVWESQIANPEFHFYSIQKVGTVSYIIEDIKGDMFNEKGIKTMVDASKSLKEGASVKPNS